MGGADGSYSGSAGLVPVPAATDNTKFLRGDGTWQTVSGSGGSGNVGTTQLWSNSSPTSSFLAADVTLSDSILNYDLIVIEYLFSTTSPYYIYSRTFLSDTLIDSMHGPNSRFSTYVDVPFTLDINASGNNRTGGRNFTVASATKLSFAAGGYNGSSSANAYAVPITIYGIRFAP